MSTCECQYNSLFSGAIDILQIQFLQHLSKATPLVYLGDLEQHGTMGWGVGAFQLA
jgi:hypothetical protein